MQHTLNSNLHEILFFPELLILLINIACQEYLQ